MLDQIYIMSDQRKDLEEHITCLEEKSPVVNWSELFTLSCLRFQFLTEEETPEEPPPVTDTATLKHFAREAEVLNIVDYCTTDNFMRAYCACVRLFLLLWCGMTLELFFVKGGRRVFLDRL